MSHFAVGHLEGECVPCVSENVGQASSLPVGEASWPRLSSGKMPPKPADKMSAPHCQCVVCERTVAHGQWYSRIKRDGHTLWLCSPPCAARFYRRRLPLLRHLNLLALLEPGPSPAELRLSLNEQ